LESLLSHIIEKLINSDDSIVSSTLIEKNNLESNLNLFGVGTPLEVGAEAIWVSVSLRSPYLPPVGVIRSLATFSVALRLDKAPGGETTAPFLGFWYPPLGI
jgi:hypothetical protein